MESVEHVEILAVLIGSSLLLLLKRTDGLKGGIKVVSYLGAKSRPTKGEVYSGAKLQFDIT